MDRFEADYFDGRSSRRYRVEATVVAGRLVLRGDGVEAEYLVSLLTIKPRVGSAPFRIGLPDGGVLVTEADIGLALDVPRPEGIAHVLETRIKYVIASLVGLIVTGTLGYLYGVPWLAREVAYRIPPELEADIARQGLKELDRIVFKPTQLEPERQEELRKAFAQLTGAGDVAAKLEFRDGGFIGANAFALPGGVVVMTDQLEAAMDNDDRVVAVLAHEVGHLHNRHGARHVLEDSIAALAATALLGDVSAVGSLVATLPSVVLHTANSRAFEREADQFAYGLLRKTGRSPKLLGEALEALEKERDRRRSPSECRTTLETPEGAEPPKEPEKPKTPRRSFDLGYLSTHPATAERIRAAEEAAR